MTSPEARASNPVRRAVGISAAVYAGTFVVAVLLHLGVQIPLGFAVLDEPQRPFAVIVESLAGAMLAVGAYAVFARKAWAWAAVTGAHGLALAGVAWGMVAVAAGRGPHTQLNDTFHRVMVVLLGAGLILLLTPLGRRSLGRQRRSRGEQSSPDRGSGGTGVIGEGSWDERRSRCGGRSSNGGAPTSRPWPETGSPGTSW
jgi:hypothetical protein